MKRVLLFTFLLVTSLSSSAQISAYSKPAEWQFTVLPTQLLVKELVISIQKLPDRKKVSYEYSIGYKAGGSAPLIRIEPKGLYGGYLYQQFAKKYYSEVYFSIAPTYNFGERFYLSCEFFGRYWWIRKTEVNFDQVEPPGLKVNAIRNEDIYVTGFKLLTGQGFAPVTFNNQTKLFLKVYLGVGYRIKFYEFTNLSGLVNDLDAAGSTESGFVHNFSMQGGLKVGISWKKRD